MKKHGYLWSLMVMGSLASCEQAAKYQENHGPIVLGDSSTIVTETDSQYLKDLVVDLEETMPAATEVISDEDTFKNEQRAKELAAQQKADSLAAIKAKENEAKAKKESEPNKKLTAKQKREAAAKKAAEDKKKKAATKKK